MQIDSKQTASTVLRAAPGRGRGRLPSIALLLLASAAVSEEGLVAHYRFDEGSGSVVRDAGPHGLNGTIHGATYRALDEGYALEFDGVDDHVIVPDSPHLQLAEAVTVMVWLNTPAESTQNVLGKNGCSVLRQNYRLNLSRTQAGLTVVECPEHGKEVTGDGVKSGSWFHVAGTFEAGKIRMYVDGALRGEQLEDAFDTGTLEAPLYIGGSFYGPGLNGLYTGQIDDVRIYSRALSEDEIHARYEAEKDLRVSTLDRLLAQVSPSESRDTTPPSLHSPRPAPDTQQSGPVVLTAIFEEHGAGIDVSSAVIEVDGVDYTGRAQIDSQGVRLALPELRRGVHEVSVVVADEAGNLGNALRWRFGIDTPVKTTSGFEDGVFRVDGEPYFPVGIYSSSVSPWYHLPIIEHAAAAGINYKLAGERNIVPLLDELQQVGMKGLVQVYWASQDLRQGGPEPLTQLVESVRSHPANLGWWNEYSSVNETALATDTYEIIRRLDADHPVLYMLAWAGELSDAYFVYAYPILNPLLPDDSILSMDELVLQPAFDAVREEGEGKQVWFGSQAFDYRLDSNRGKVITLEGGFRPTRAEIRSMNYFALTKGVKGLCFYAPSGEIPGTDYVEDVSLFPRQWTEMLKIATQVRYLAPTLAAGKVAAMGQLAQGAPAIHFIELVHDDEHTLIAVNAEPQHVLATWEFQEPVPLLMLFEDRVSEGPVETFTDLFEPLEVHVYRWSAP
ncbi:MAG: LamG domain-containing protein [Gemmatimonadetes bacterium]|nr:LamG domain-containing protein [Gemmatimonadota bacterium]